MGTVTPTLDRWKPNPAATWAIGVAGIAAIGALDYASGTELRVYPAYYLPVSLLAWHAGRRGAFGAAILSGATWFVSNELAGMQFSHAGLWAANLLMHTASFLFVGILIAVLQQARAEARALSRTDPLTHLLNGRAFYEDAVPLLALCRRGGRPVTLAYIDLDYFKPVNDRRGHGAGDALLGDVADAIRRSVRPSDLCARLGGDEFAILLPELPHAEAATTIERVRAAVVAAGQLSDPGVTASAGAVTFPIPPHALEPLVRRADELMYASKAAGRNRLTVDVVDTAAASAAAPIISGPR